MEQVKNMNKLNNANVARLEQQLYKLYRFSDGVRTLEQELKNSEIIGYKAIQKYTYNRHKFNSMDNEEQEVYMNQVRNAPMEYFAVYKNGNLLQIPKIVFNHYNNGVES